MMPVPDLHRLFAPRSVALVGASENLDSISGRPLRLLKEHGFSGRLYPVNPRHENIDGTPCFPDVGSLPETPDVVLVGVRAALVPGALEACAARGVPFAVIFSSGFAESHDPESERRMVEIARAGGMRLLGPNCQGMANFREDIPLTFSSSLLGRTPPPGGVAYVSQSGAFGFASAAQALDRGVRFHSVVTTGNQCDLDALDVGRYLLRDPDVRALLLYLEGVRDGERFVNLAEEARSRGIPLGVLKVGRSPTSREAVQSHTAALAGDDAVWDAIFRQYDVFPLEDAEDIVNLGLVFGAPRRPRGNRVAILTTSGGAGIVTADRCFDAGLAVPPLPEETRRELERFLPSFGSSRNPVDMTAQVINDPQGYAGVLRAVETCAEVDMTIAVHSMVTGAAGESMARDLADSFDRSEKPTACCWLIDQRNGGAFLSFLRQRGVPVFSSPRECARALGALARVPREVTPSIPACPRPAPVLGNFPPVLTEYDAKRALSAYGVPCSREILCATFAEARNAAAALGYPVALKVMSPAILHKTEAGVVALRLREEEELRNAYGRLLERAEKFAPGVPVQGVLVQEMVDGGVECFVGVKRDPLFGAMVAVGLGGIYVEVFRDAVLRRAPVSPQEGEAMVRSLRGYPLLAGVRGQKLRDVEALGRLIGAVSDFACSEEELLELDVNPVMVLEEGQGVVAVDALVTKKGFRP